MDAIRFILFVIGGTIFAITGAGALIGAYIVIGKYLGIYGVFLIMAVISAIWAYFVIKGMK
jgi:hypothetical protein